MSEPLSPRSSCWCSWRRRILALPGRTPPRAVARRRGMGCAGQDDARPRELAAVVSGAGRPVVAGARTTTSTSPGERRHRQGGRSAEGYLDDSFDRGGAAPAGARPGRCRRPPPSRPASYDLAADRPVQVDAVPGAVGRRWSAASRARSCSVARSWPTGGTWRCWWSPTRRGSWSARLVRDADLGTPEQVRELYLRRYLAAESLHQERDDPWSHADVVVELIDPTTRDAEPPQHRSAEPNAGRAAARQPPTLVHVGHVDVNGISYYLPDGRLLLADVVVPGRATAPRSRWSAPTAPARPRCCGSSPATSTRTRARSAGPAGSG